MCSNALSLFLTDEIPMLLHFIDLHHSVQEDYVSLFNLDTSLSSYQAANDIITFDGSMYGSNTDTSNFAHSVSVDKSEEALTFYKIKMEATNVKKNILSFYPLQNYVYTIPGESTLIFYRLENLTDTAMQSLSVYVTSPAEAVAYVKKLQCFCYEELMISPKCIIDLPILFSLDEEVLNEDFKEITINYILLLKDKK